MDTYITSAHEEEYSDKSTSLGVLLNYDMDNKRIDSLIYIYRQSRKMYIFFNTIVDMNEFMLYGDGKIKRAYLGEEEFDAYYDRAIDGKFSDKLAWT